MTGSTVIPGLTTTVGDRERVLEQLKTEFRQLELDIASKMQHQDNRDPVWQWWQIAGKPTVDEWLAFYADQVDSWWAKFSTDWDVYTDWQKRMIRLREAAAAKLKELGRHRLDTPDPVNLPGIPWEGLGEGAQHAADEAAKMLKVAGYTAIGIAGAFAIAAIASSAIRSRR